MTAVIIWFLTALIGPRMDEGGPIAHPGSLGTFHTKAECEKAALGVVKKLTSPGQVATYSCVKGSENSPESYRGENEKEYQVPVPLPEVFVVLIGKAHLPEGLHWEPQSVWPTKEQCQIEADKKQSETTQPDYDRGNMNRNWPIFKCVVYKPTVKRARY
jgi:hypothetical protein